MGGGLVGLKFKLKASDFGWDGLLKIVRASAGGSSVEVGVFEDSPSRKEEITNAEIALVHEFGSPAANIPERSFLRSTVDANREAYHKAIDRVAQHKLDGKDTSQELDRLGMRVAADVKRTIQAGIDPPLQPETIARKGSSKPLVDTGQLITSVSHRVVEKE